MAKTSAKEFQERFSKAKAAKENWRSTLTECYDLFLPQRQNFTTQTKGSTKSGDLKLFDDTGKKALQEFSNNIKSKLLPSYQRWAELKPGGKIEAEVLRGTDGAKEDRDELQQTLESINKVMFQYIWQSNFDQAVHESIQDMSISTGALLCVDTGDVDNPIRFIAVPADELTAEKGPNGDIKTAYREHSIKARNILLQWPRAKVDEGLQRLIIDNPDQDVKFIEGTVYNDKTKDYTYVVFTEEAKTNIILEETLETSPWIIFRWNVVPGEIYGRGPAFSAKENMKQLNKLVQQLMLNNDMAINPPLLLSGKDFVNAAQIRIRPGAVIRTKADYSGMQAPVQYLESRANFNLGINARDELKADIKETFYSQALGDINGAVKSATEIQIRNNNQLQQMGAAFGRLQQELVGQVIKRVYSILSGYGIVPDVVKVDGLMAEVKASSPMAKVQQLQDVENAMNLVQTFMAFGEQGMAMLATTVKMDDFGPWLAENSGFPVELRMSKEEREEFAEQIQQQAMQPQQMQPQEGIM